MFLCQVTFLTFPKRYTLYDSRMIFFEKSGQRPGRKQDPVLTAGVSGHQAGPRCFLLPAPMPCTSRDATAAFIVTNVVSQGRQGMQTCTGRASPTARGPQPRGTGRPPGASPWPSPGSLPSGPSPRGRGCHSARRPWFRRQTQRQLFIRTFKWLPGAVWGPRVLFVF